MLLMGFGLARRRAHPPGLPGKVVSTALPPAWDKPAQGHHVSRGLIKKNPNTQNPTKPKNPSAETSRSPILPHRAASFSDAILFCGMPVALWGSRLFPAGVRNIRPRGRAGFVPRPSLPFGVAGGFFVAPVHAASDTHSVVVLLPAGRLVVRSRAVALLRKPKGAEIWSFSAVR